MLPIGPVRVGGHIKIADVCRRAHRTEDLVNHGLRAEDGVRLCRVRIGAWRLRTESGANPRHRETTARDHRRRDPAPLEHCGEHHLLAPSRMPVALGARATSGTSKPRSRENASGVFAMHCLRIRLTRYRVFTCTYAVDFGSCREPLFICKTPHASRGRRWLIMVKGNEN
jgi:hypothetical protein